MAVDLGANWILASAKEQWDRQLALILLFGLSNGILYACLLPLWDGFDEPFHYGYVTSLSVDHRLPTLHNTNISQEVQQSLRLTPLAPALSRAIPDTSSLDEWLSLSEAERSARRVSLDALPSGLRREKSGVPNYEAQQAPLAYMLLAPLDWLLSNEPLGKRILVIRLAISVSSTLLLACASIALFQALGLERRFRNIALFLLFATQTTWAAVAHVGNDWLAIPVSASFLAALAVLVKRGGQKPAVWLAILFSAGLLAKAYFLAFVPIFLAALLRELVRKTLRPTAVLLTAAMPFVIAGPWYLRNLILYGSVQGTNESASGIGMARTLEAFPQINWLTSIVRLARGGLWTGNWSFIVFPRWPLNPELVLAGAALVVLIAGRRKLASSERWVLGTCAMFLLAMAYQQASVWAFTGGAIAGAEPWYLECIMPGIVSLVALGLQNGAWAGRLLAGLLALVSGGISAASYVGILFPWYGGFRGHGSLEVLRWWRSADSASVLSTVTIVPAACLFVLLTLFLGFLAVAIVVVCRQAVQRIRSEPKGMENNPHELNGRPLPL
jgi:hypothetical protein